MAQINIHVEKDVDELFTYLAQKKKISKAVYVKNLALENLKEKILPELLKDYETGKIGAKKVMQLLQLTADEFLTAIHTHNIKCPLTSELDDYTHTNLVRILKNME